MGAQAKFNFQLEYPKGQDNAVADMLSQITTHLGPEAMQAILDEATIGSLREQKDRTLLLLKVINRGRRKYKLLLGES